MSLFGRRPKASGFKQGQNQPFELRHPGHPLGSDYLIQMETGCWIWKWAAKNNYATVSHNGTMPNVTRILMCAEAGQEVRHSQNCSTTRCINPAHLRLGDKSDNCRDAVVDGRSAVPRKLTDDQAAEIRKRYQAGGVTYKQLAIEYNISSGPIGGIVNNKTYAYRLDDYERH